MANIPGFTLLGAVRPTGSNILFHAVRNVDSLKGIIKTPMAVSPSPRERERYRREFGILQRLRDVSGVPKAHSCELVFERPVLLLEEVEGTPLSEFIGQPFEVARFLDVAISLASTLAEIHRHNVIHKDIKPSNIILLPSGEARVIDFGTATLQQIEHVEAAPTNLIEGTLAYMSPEQTGRMNRTVDYRTDLYSLGVTFYELLTGTLPFRGRDALEWFHAHMAQLPKPPNKLIPSIPAVVSSLVMRLLAKVAEERYQSAEGLKADLERCREGLRRGALEEFPLGTEDVPLRFQLPQRLYGRDAQVTALLEGFERVVQDGRPELILVSGYSGLGKSSVVHELHKPVVRQRGFFLTGKFDQFQRDIPYATLAQAIHGLVEQLLAGSDESLARWRERLLQAWEGHGQLLLDMVPPLEFIAGPQPPVPELPPAEAQNRFIRTFQRFLAVFATAEHPLAVFLDDLQWADLASLRLIQHLLTQEGMPPVLWLGAYRDNELSPSHSLVLALQEIRKAGARVADLRLEPLSLEQVQQLVADSLPGADREVVEPLSARVHEKTAGNPFFLVQLLSTLHQDGLLVRTQERGWRWDAEGVKARGYSDNVVDFMVGRLRQLSFGTQHLLRLAACVGHAFSLPMLATLSGSLEPEQVEQELEPVLQEGFLARSGPEQYRFLHDRIQQAAHALIPEQDRKAVHLRIGRLLLASLSPDEVHEKLFDVVSQLNAGAELIQEPEERLRVARLNAEAGLKAKASMAHQSAVVYFKKALEFFPEDPWQTDYELTFKIEMSQATCEFMSGNLAEVRHLVEELQRRARTRTDMAAAACLRSELHLVVGEIPQAVDCLLEFLGSVGMPMSAHPAWEEVVAAHDEVWNLMGERSVESLVDLPLMTDPDMQAAIHVLSALFAPSYFTDNNLLALQLCRVVSLSLRYGNTEGGTHGYGWFGVVTGSFFKRYQEGHAFGLLARELVERHRFFAFRGKVLFAQETLNPWTQPMNSSLELARTGFQYSLQAGDFPIACFCCSHIVTDRLSLGHRLEDVYQEAVSRRDFARKVGYADIDDVIRLAQQYSQQMRGLTSSFNRLDDDGFDEQGFEARLTPNRLTTLHCWYWLTKMQSRFMCGEFEQAREAGEKVAPFLWSSFGLIQLLDYHLYRALTLAACFDGVTPDQQREFLDDMRRHHHQLAEWARECPQNFLGPERMVFAEISRVTGQRDEATTAYEEAIHSAQENGFIQNVGLANELAARFWNTRRAPSIFRAFAHAAHTAYGQWGALGKVQHLEAQWPELVSPSSRTGHLTTTTTTTSTDSMQIDALTVVKAQLAISSEIVLERLVAMLMQVALENAGAQRGALLLARGDTLVVVATSGASQGWFSASSEEESSRRLPWSLIAYVKRTREHVLVGDASKPHSFSSDAYLEGGGVRSLLCLPLLRQESFDGVLYLENNLATNAFTPGRLSLLKHLASQAAISIENARLYGDIQRAEAALRRANDDLERRVEERTRELRELQERLVDTAREVGMTEVASNVLHSVGNVLTSTVINFEEMLGTLNGSRIDRVKKASSMLKQSPEELVHFLTRDPRGTRLASYLEELGDELLREHERLREGLWTMGQHIEHIRVIVQVQQNYARTTLLVEECDLSQLIEDALRIQMAALQRHGVSAMRELSPVPRIRADKHKVLQILINLISNAKDALDSSPAGQRSLLVRLERLENRVRVQVVDNGAGIAPEIREHLFSHGFTTRKEGHGFGLHTSALAAQMMGGRLTLESEGPGKGATATLEIPLGDT
ncbi:trifunctional serine/threonine-protein kinase/ATP-binding protein/sensor histidine kinase [Hyalangium versicolor]|uniref:trifunctional serine/threonine-protein kinase/ATP-binding protein/sensor histidine kinase n=1 Tax=Hyalangium versicolor TaxID=2861190 RepID=UPI001CCC1088|nr:ATP-binding sensor histidine kinase [Hyalangium versicolor]